LRLYSHDYKREFIIIFLYYLKAYLIKKCSLSAVEEVPQLEPEEGDVSAGLANQMICILICMHFCLSATI